MNCPACGVAAAPRARICLQCGAALTAAPAPRKTFRVPTAPSGSQPASHADALSPAESAASTDRQSSGAASTEPTGDLASGSSDPLAVDTLGAETSTSPSEVSITPYRLSGGVVAGDAPSKLDERRSSTGSRIAVAALLIGIGAAGGILLGNPAIFSSGTPSSTGTQPSATDPDDDAWAIAQQKGDPEALSSYLRNYPGGHHSDEAGAALARLTSPPDSPAPTVEPPTDTTTADLSGDGGHDSASDNEPETQLPASVRNDIRKLPEPMADAVLHGVKDARPTANFSADFCKSFYPAASRRLEERGTVELWVYVTEDGRPARTQVEKSSGYARLDEAAERCVIGFGRFLPPSVDGSVSTAVQRFVITW